ncbi:MAG TPA: hypothetical protein VEI46_05550 [Thermodesulfovibrionales bacterium]|nr:hypothetical protein [Thermodesulfovibrionales bacterium]
MRLLIEDLAILGLSLNIVDELKETLIKNIKRKILPEENPPLKGGILGRDLLVTEGRSESKEVEVT